MHEGLGISSTKTVATEEKPFVEIEDLKTLANNVAVVLPSNGERTLAATKVYLRPLWVFKKHMDLSLETSWFDWPQDLRGMGDQDGVTAHPWRGWDGDGQVSEADVVPASARLGRFVQTPRPPRTNVQKPEPTSLPSTRFPESVFASLPEEDDGA